MGPLWDTVKAKPFIWTEQAETAFQKTKLEIAKCTTALGYFDDKAKTIIYTDASPAREPVGSMTAQMVEDASKNDQEMQKLRIAIETDEWLKEMRAFEKLKDELRIEGYLIVRLGALIIPAALRADVLRLAHCDHPGQSAMKSAMRKRVWWLGMAGDADRWVETCPACNLVARPEFPVPLRTTVLPQEPWEKIAVDFNGPHAACGGRSILVIVNYFSRFVVARFVKSTDINSVTTTLESVFEVLGNPASIRSDNGPPYNGAEWKNYCENQGINVEFSTPGHPQQNGLVERYMQLVNKIITIAVETNQDPEKLLREAVDAHNMATQRTTYIAPEVLLFGRSRRRKLPIVGRTAVLVNEDELRSRDAEGKSKMRNREDKKRHARETKLKVGDRVLLKRHLKAKDQTIFDPTHFQVLEGASGDYKIRAPDGRTLKRNVTHLKKIQHRDIQQSEVQGTRVNKQDPKPQQRSRRAPAHLADYVLNSLSKKEN